MYQLIREKGYDILRKQIKRTALKICLEGSISWPSELITSSVNIDGWGELNLRALTPTFTLLSLFDQCKPKATLPKF